MINWSNVIGGEVCIAEREGCMRVGPTQDMSPGYDGIGIKVLRRGKDWKIGQEPELEHPERSSSFPI